MTDDVSRIRIFRDAARRKYSAAVSEMAQMNILGTVHGKSRAKLEELMKEANKYFFEWGAYDSALKILGELS